MDNSNSRDQALHVATLLMRPLIRLLTQYGVGLNDWVELSKRVYVEQAARRLQQDGGRITDAALSTMTGVHRKDVKRIGVDAALEPTGRRKPSLLDAVMSLWTGDARFIDARGAARALARRGASKEGLKETQGRSQASLTPSGGLARSDRSGGVNEACFEDLIEGVSKGVPPRALLDAWLQQGVVRLDEEGRVCWAKPERAAGEELQSMARSALMSADRLSAAMGELYGPRAGHFLFSVRGEGLLKDDVQGLHALVQRWGRAFGNRLNKRVTEAQARGREQGGDQRYSFGVHSYGETLLKSVDRPS